MSDLIERLERAVANTGLCREAATALRAKDERIEAWATLSKQNSDLAAESMKRAEAAESRIRDLEAALRELDECGAIDNWMRVADELRARIRALLGDKPAITQGRIKECPVLGPEDMVRNGENWVTHERAVSHGYRCYDAGFTHGVCFADENLTAKDAGDKP